ncbi:ATP synthase epsilon chain [Aquimixticola soesokkakensis]|uniref:ATP synthase epsilon chain n=1 Tax=Aquimixticola soesokkakensis TaxID=1519096 RepID=A0A1Y5RQQ0_9RHOB|nr:F0F1 ATP synthase subunit epsilon [Aquimixticola soesokkakensis]SLN20437.1 ATP synthase epsilon chain [Aquimixticola soesokkakensis]
MADLFQFDLVSPERKLASVQATEVIIPGSEGDLTAMANHAPTILTLRPGVLTVVSPAGDEYFVVTGGFAELGPDGVSVLAEVAVPKDEMTNEFINSLIKGAEKAHANAHPDAAHAAAKFLSDLVAVGTHIGLDPNQPSI